MMWERFQASLIHLALSLMLLLPVSVGLFYLCYPAQVIAATDVTSILIIIVCVDIVLGPVITAIIYKENKKKFRRDLLIVVTVQMAALGYGMATLYAGRPVFLVFNVDRFTLVRANELTLHESVGGSISVPNFGVSVVAAKMPENGQERQQILITSVTGGPDLAQMPRYYVDYQAIESSIRQHMFEFDILINRQGAMAKAGLIILIQNILEKNKVDADSVGFIPVNSGDKNLTAIVRKKDLQLLQLIEANPWAEQ